MDLFDLYVKIALDPSEFNAGIEDASGKTSSFAEKLKTGLANAAKVGAAAITAVTAATTAMTAAVIKGVSQTAEYGDNIDKMSQKMGMTAEAYQEWDAVMQHCGTSIDSMQSSMKTLASAAETGNDAFEKLGLSQESIAGMSQEELFGATITALQNVESETERTYLAGQLLGRGATELGALLNTSAEDTQAMKDRVHELGGVMSDEAVKAAAAYQDSLQDMQTAFSGLSRGVMGEFLPSITTVMDGLTAIFSGDGDTGIALINQGVSDFVDNLTSVIPEVLNTGAQIVSSLITAVTDNLPALIDAGIDVVMQLLTGIADALPELATSAVSIVNQIVESISENLPMLLEAALETILALANGIAESLPELIPTIVDVELQIVETLIDNVDMLIDAAIAIIIALADGLVNSLPTLIEEIPGLVIKIVEAIIENAPKLLEAAAEIIAKLTSGLIEGFADIAIKVGGWLYDNIVQPIIDKVSDFKDAGKQLLEGLWNGISDKVEWLKEKVSGVVNKIKSWFTGSEGFDEHSPSKWSNHVFRYVMEGGGKGLEDGLPDLMQDVRSVTDRVKSGLDLDFGVASVDYESSALGVQRASIGSAVRAAGESGVTGPITINLVTPTGHNLATWLIGELRDYSRAYGVSPI